MRRFCGPPPLTPPSQGGEREGALGELLAMSRHDPLQQLLAAANASNRQPPRGPDRRRTVNVASAYGKTNSLAEIGCITSGLGRDAILKSKCASARLTTTGLAFLSRPMAYWPVKGSRTSAVTEMICGLSA